MSSRSSAVIKFLGCNEVITNTNLWKSLIGEFVGTFLLVLVGVGSCIAWPNINPQPDLVKIALTVGVAVATIVQCICHVSGGHINPAVSLGMVVTGKITLLRFLFYVICQCAGAIVGASLLKAVTPHDLQKNLGITTLDDDVGEAEGFAVELFITFVLVFTVFAVCDPNRNDIKGSAPLAIGLSITACHLFAIPFTGSSMNPARSFGPAIVMNEWDHHWVYWIGPLLGGAAAAILYELVLSAPKPNAFSIEDDHKRGDV